MIILYTDTFNQFVVTGRERSQIFQSGSTPFYLLSLHNQSTNVDKAVIIPILSSCSRYDLCSLIISGSTYENLSAGTISLNDNTGFYDYNIYEKNIQDTNSNTNLNLLETGLLELKNTSTKDKPAFDDDFIIQTFNG